MPSFNGVSASSNSFQMNKAVPYEEIKKTDKRKSIEPTANIEPRMSISNQVAPREEETRVEKPRKNLGTKKYSVMDSAPVKTEYTPGRYSAMLSGATLNNLQTPSQLNAGAIDEDYPYNETREKLERIYKEQPQHSREEISTSPERMNGNNEETEGSALNANSSSKKNLNPNKRFSQNVDLQPRGAPAKKRTLSQSFNSGSKPSISPEEFEQMRKEAEIIKNLKKEEAEREKKRRSFAQAEKNAAAQQQQALSSGGNSGKRKSAFVFPASGSAAKNENRRSTENNPAKIRASVKASNKEAEPATINEEQEKPRKRSQIHTRSKSVYEGREPQKRSSSSTANLLAEGEARLTGSSRDGDTLREYADIAKKLKLNADKLAVKSFLVILIFLNGILIFFSIKKQKLFL